MQLPAFYSFLEILKWRYLALSLTHTHTLSPQIFRSCISLFCFYAHTRTPPPPTFPLHDSLLPSPKSVGGDQKLNQLVAFIAQHKESKMIVYFNACACVDYFSRVLPLLKPLRHTNIIALHGKIAPKVSGWAGKGRGAERVGMEWSGRKRSKMVGES